SEAACAFAVAVLAAESKKRFRRRNSRIHSFRSHLLASLFQGLPVVLCVHIVPLLQKRKPTTRSTRQAHRIFEYRSCPPRDAIENRRPSLGASQEVIAAVGCGSENHIGTFQLAECPFHNRQGQRRAVGPDQNDTLRLFIKSATEKPGHALTE